MMFMLPVILLIVAFTMLPTQSRVGANQLPREGVVLEMESSRSFVFNDAKIHVPGASVGQVGFLEAVSIAVVSSVARTQLNSFFVAHRLRRERWRWVRARLHPHGASRQSAANEAKHEHTIHRYRSPVAAPSACLAKYTRREVAHLSDQVRLGGRVGCDMYEMSPCSRSVTCQRRR